MKDREAWCAAVHGIPKSRCDLATEHQQMMGLWECNPIVSQGVTIYSFKKQKTNSLHLCTVFKKVFKFLFIYIFFIFGSAGSSLLCLGFSLVVVSRGYSLFAVAGFLVMVSLVLEHGL